MVEVLSNYTAEIIALCALVFTAYHVIVQRRHNVLSVQPHITTFINRNRNDQVGQLQVQLMNNGLGPAFINEFQAYLDRKPCEAHAAVDSLLNEYQVNTQVSTLGDDYAMPAGEVRNLLTVVFPCKSDEEMDIMEGRLDRLDLMIRYSSAYGNERTYDSRNNSSQVH